MVAKKISLDPEFLFLKKTKIAHLNILSRIFVEEISFQ